MEGGARQRHCALCDKDVHNFAAMTAGEIERTVRAADGKLCARITRREDGSLVTLQAQPRVSAAGQWLASASLAVGAAGAFAQSVGEVPKKAEAVLTGTVLMQDGSGPVAGAVVSLRTPDEVAASVKADEHGNFRIVVQPGTYDVLIRQNMLYGTRVFSANLHEGEQSLEAVKTHFTMFMTTEAPMIQSPWVRWSQRSEAIVCIAQFAIRGVI